MIRAGAVVLFSLLLSRVYTGAEAGAGARPSVNCRVALHRVYTVTRTREPATRANAYRNISASLPAVSERAGPTTRAETS